MTGKPAGPKLSDRLLAHAGVAATPLGPLQPPPPDPVAAAMAALREREENERQVADLRVALVQQPDSFELTLALAERLRRLGRRSESAAAYARALELNPARTDLRHLLAASGGAPAPTRADDGYVRALFDGAAEKFDEVLVDQLGYRAPQHCAAALGRHLASGAPRPDALDLGCGTGLLGPLIKPLVARLEGVDLSSAMVAKARSRRCYDRLHVAEIGAHLAKARPFGVVLAADVFVYFGDLQPAFAAVARVLKAPGLFIFTVERGASGWVLGPAGRYAHGDDHVRAAATAAGLGVREVEEVTLRIEERQPVLGRVYVLAR